MRARRRLIIVALSVLIFVAAVVIVVLLRKQAAPEPARLLPEADAVVYIDFASVRALANFDQQPLPHLAPGYDDFVKQTGFAFERDLDEAAMAIHRNAAYNNGHREDRYTEILVGRYDQLKLSQYLRQHARAMETYRDIDIYSVPIENRTLRVALLAIDTVVVSNTDDRGVVTGIIDRFRKVALPFGGPTLVRTYYERIPLGSLLWAISRLPDARHVSPSGGETTSGTTATTPAKPTFTLPGGLDVGLPGSSDVIVSLRMLSTIRARAEFFTQSETQAQTFVDQTTAFLALFRSIQATATPTPDDADIKTVFDSIKIARHGERADVTATIPPSFLRKLVADPAKSMVNGGK